MTTGVREPTACAHCGLPLRDLSPRRVATRARFSSGGSGPFCCTGCEIVWHLSGPRGEGQTDRLLARIVLSAFLAMGVMICSLALYSGYLSGGDARELGSEAAQALTGLYRLGALALSLPVVYLLGLPLALAVWRGRRWLSADGLILIGTAAALAVSLWNTLIGSGAVYFETATMVLVLVGLGRWLDTRAKDRASAQLRSLAAESIPRAALVEAGIERTVDLADLVVGDLVRVRPGEPIPVDGTVVHGRSFVDTSALTGESEPRAADMGTRVLAGGTALDGTLVVRAEAVGKGRVRDEVDRLLKEALSGVSAHVRLADRLAATLVPVVAVLALGTLVWHWRYSDLETAWMSAFSVVLISCPCALGIATPLAFWTALGSAWRQGVLIRGADVLERMARVRRVFLDKTGTLTSPEVEITAIEPLGQADTDRILELSAALELGSEHPLGRSLVRTWLRRPEATGTESLPLVTDFQVLPGIGVSGRIEGALLELRRAANAQTAETTIELLTDGGLLARIRARSELRPGAEEAVERLQLAGLHPTILTGDAAGPAADIAARLGLEEHHDLLPADKVRTIEAAGPVGVMYVGDGLNDAASLAVADVGVAVAGGSPRSLQAADVCLLRDGVPALPDLLQLAQRAVGTARSNLAWAFAYNGVGWWLAITGRLTPVFAAAAMVASSLAVVLNSRRAAHGTNEPSDTPEPHTSLPVAFNPSGGGS